MEPVKLVDGVTATIVGLKVAVKGMLGELSSTTQGGITAKSSAALLVRLQSDSVEHRNGCFSIMTAHLDGIGANARAPYFCASTLLRDSAEQR